VRPDPYYALCCFAPLAVFVFAEQQDGPEQHWASALQPLPSAAQQLSPALQQSAVQQLSPALQQSAVQQREPSTQQAPSALHWLPSLQHPWLIDAEQVILTGFDELSPLAA